MKIKHCNLCVKQGRVECRPEDLMQIKMTGDTYCENALSLKGYSMIPATRFCQNHTEEPLDKLLRIVADNPQESSPGGMPFHGLRLLKALKEENSK